jgi:hypothetical protein
LGRDKLTHCYEFGIANAILLISICYELRGSPSAFASCLSIDKTEATWVAVKLSIVRDKLDLDYQVRRRAQLNGLSQPKSIPLCLKRFITTKIVIAVESIPKIKCIHFPYLCP